ncbi:hypothetical protein A3H80_02955 [Candidatus Roizmanbacteria bacterium RIFCSPLOWO2_02_FULL_37_19]|uniref:Uncharacterized protein n=1 Tax=Candidatus Roizmanbacteria bacterium RIFCSPHIGHO2_02_FULL_37_24 TaxID=1802037 RepID=A0A1F7H0N7_9BACT|nr:MAG: hypothetical protein A2862_03770 [Candidatus Roizmanbacteria bacterium RIFCSPHIGHO2_01_FULL_38_41]OGK24282.1 MAG: hypothetical protein A3C24_04250 [Candidatus Roizmanbacteria bacterium RIFCSPHIGHO2_02_FULL_37_24]OGK32162.1 MAG: hypothetical protein A3E10_03505 [Candidatus Roizmanbacteria bacterium RIFCSPHIGHO2_12_FULL_37_23]OGK43832.1 MAG: hypothetical protein A2956_04910 [Candidatus Roizmanbacteria bacterium RIFCSPLOWO2_01_FULL_37_57]OGK53819.1 MAG: hypothetical protein A3H80_02955 [Ca
MLIAIIVILIILWFLGYAPISSISIPDLVLFSINNHQITLWDIFVLAVIVWAIGILPRPFQIIASVLLLLWILSVLGIFAIAGLSNILVIAIIIALILSVLL